MPLKRLAEIKAATAASLTRIDLLIEAIGRSLDVIEARLRSCAVTGQALTLREHQRRTLQ
jgi:hypothetical protein